MRRVEPPEFDPPRPVRLGDHGRATVPSITARAPRSSWRHTVPLITELLAADTVLLGVPMCTFSVGFHFVAAELTLAGGLLPHPGVWRGSWPPPSRGPVTTSWHSPSARPQWESSSSRAASRASAAGRVLRVIPAVTMAPSASRKSGPASAAGLPAAATREAR